MAHEHLERELKLDVGPDFELPRLPGDEDQRYELSAAYHDTEQAWLQAQGVTLRRRTGGADEGWHLKVPHPQGRVEIQTDLASTTPPDELNAMTRGLRFDQPLRQTAVLHTDRRSHLVRNGEGELVAEVSDDRVEATVEATGRTESWRELEVELGPAGDVADLRRLADQLTSAGATASSSRSKYARAVGDRTRPPLAGTPGLVDDYLRTHVGRMVLGDLWLRRGVNRVHKTRVAVRRARSTLRVFGDLVDEQRAAELDRELRWYAECLGEVRDLDVFLARLTDYLEREWARTPEPVLSLDDRDELVRAVEARRDQSWERLAEVLEGERYGSLLRMLGQWQEEAPWTEAVADADPVGTYLRRARKKADQRLRKAEAAAPEHRVEALHRARKAAKRARYAAEVARPALGKQARRTVKRYRRRQDDLGLVQDHRTMTAILVDVADGEATSPRLAFACGVLAERHLMELDKALG